MKLAFPQLSLCLAFFCFHNQPASGGDVGGLVLAVEPIYVGVISDVNATAITFEVNSSTDADGNDVDPFVPGVFNSAVKVPVLTASVSSGAVNAIAKTYVGSGFSGGTPPKVFIDYPDGDDNQSTATLALDGSGVVNDG